MRGVLKRDFIAASVLLLFLLILWSNILDLPKDVKTFPFVVMGIMAINLIIIIVKALIRKEDTASATGPFFNRDFIVITLFLVFYYFIFRFLGFYVTSALFTLFLYIYLMRKLSSSTLIKGVCFSLLLTAILYLLFNISLNLVTPKGILF